MKKKDAEKLRPRPYRAGYGMGESLAETANILYLNDNRLQFLQGLKARVDDEINNIAFKTKVDFVPTQAKTMNMIAMIINNYRKMDITIFCNNRQMVNYLSLHGVKAEYLGTEEFLKIKE